MMGMPQNMGMGQGQQPPKTIAPPRHDEEYAQGYIAALVISCNRHIVKYHEYSFTDRSELEEELFKNPDSNFRSDFEEIYRATNIWIGYHRSNIVVKDKITDKDGYDINQIFMAIEGWLGPCPGDLTDKTKYPTPKDSFYVGHKLYELYLKVLITAELYNPLAV